MMQFVSNEQFQSIENNNILSTDRDDFSIPKCPSQLSAMDSLGLVLPVVAQDEAFFLSHKLGSLKFAFQFVERCLATKYNFWQVPCFSQRLSVLHAGVAECLLVGSWE